MSDFLLQQAWTGPAMNNTTSCPDSYRPTIYNVPATATLAISFPMAILGVLLNTFVLLLLMRQKRLSNQDMYVLVLCLSSFIMVGPCLATTIIRSWLACPKIPRILNSLTVMGLQVTAGVNVWLTCCISIDRFLIVYHHVNYTTKETKRRVILKITAIIVSHLLAGMFSNLIYYTPAFTTQYIGMLDIAPPGNPNVGMSFTVDAVQLINQILNVIRLVTDRLVPWLLCPITYLAVFVLRHRQKVAVQQGPAMGAAAAGATEARQMAERRIRRSRKLVIGISISVFISLLPETVLDFSSYAFSVDLRSKAPIVGLIWYIPNIIDPLVCIISLSNLRRRTSKLLGRVGFSRFQEKRAGGPTTGG